MSEDNNQRLLNGAWQSRKELYAELFGEHAYTLPKGFVQPGAAEPSFRMAKDSEGGEGHIERFFTAEMSGKRITIVVYAPTEQRPYWTYVTAGLSTPWFQEEADMVSGFGCELMVKSKQPGLWPFRLLRRLAFYIMSYTGTLSPGVILNMESPLGTSELNNIFVWYADEAPDAWYDLPSGGFGIFCVTGITEDECQFAESIEEYGTWCVQQVLRQTGVGQVTDPERSSVMKGNNIDAVLQSVKSYADNFRAANPAL